jgi:hypothetical protein
MILAVPHRFYLEQALSSLLAKLRKGGVVIDVKSALDPTFLAGDTLYRSL